MSTFPVVVLSQPYVAQTEYKDSDVFILQVEDNVTQKSLRAFCQLGTNLSFKYWVQVMSGDNYNVNWTNDDVVNAVKAYFVNS